MRKANRIGRKIYRKGLSADGSFLFCRKLRQRESPQEECGAFFETGALSPDFLLALRTLLTPLFLWKMVFAVRIKCPMIRAFYCWRKRQEV